MVLQAKQRVQSRQSQTGTAFENDQEQVAETLGTQSTFAKVGLTRGFQPSIRSTLQAYNLYVHACFKLNDEIK